MEAWTFLLINLVPFFILGEAVQLFVAERYIGVRQLRAGRHPLEAEDILPAWATALWIAFIIATGGYLALLLTSSATRFHGALMLAVTALFGMLRRVNGLKWTLVLLTIEGALRMGLMFQMFLGYHFFRHNKYFNWVESFPW